MHGAEVVKDGGVFGSGRLAKDLDVDHLDECDIVNGERGHLNRSRSILTVHTPS